MKRRYLFSIILLSLMLFSLISVRAETEDRTGTFSTSNGTTLSFNTTLNHDGLSSGKPSLMVNRSYVLQIGVSLTKLGSEVIDFHDLAFQIRLFSDSLIGDDLYFYEGYYFDSETRLKLQDTKIYSFDLFVSGDGQSHEASLEIVITGKENIANNRDPTSEYDGLKYAVVINPSGGVSAATTVGNDVVKKSIQSYADKQSKVQFAVDIAHNGTDSNSKPTLIAHEQYSMNFSIKLLELPDGVADIHDFSIRVNLEDESLTDILPTKDATRYYNAGYDETSTRLTTVGTSINFTLILYPATNINNTEVTMKIVLKLKENVSLLDPTSEFEISVTFLLNKGLSNVFDALLSETSGLPVDAISGIFFFIIAIPILKKRKIRK